MVQPSYEVDETIPVCSKHITWHVQYSLSYQNVIKQEIQHERNNERLLMNENEVQIYLHL